MRFKGRLEFEQGLKQFNLIPFINVIFLLLIFTMFSSAFVMQPAIMVNLPKVVTSEAVRPNTVKIALTKENIIYLNAKAVTLQDLKSFFKMTAGRDQSVLLSADKQVSLGSLAEICDLARESGVRRLNIATNQE